MLDFLFKKETGSAEILNDFYSKLKELYSFDSISEDRKKELKSSMKKFGYLPYSHQKALETLTDLLERAKDYYHYNNLDDKRLVINKEDLLNIVTDLKLGQ